MEIGCLCNKTPSSLVLLVKPPFPLSQKLSFHGNNRRLHRIRISASSHQQQDSESLQLFEVG